MHIALNLVIIHLIKSIHLMHVLILNILVIIEAALNILTKLMHLV